MDAWKGTYTLGVLTGVSYISGLDYFKGINEHVSALWKSEGRPQAVMVKNARLTLACVDCDIYVSLLAKGDNDKVAEYLFEDGIKRLHAAGAEILIIASNTAHLVCPLVMSRLPNLRILHIADCIAVACHKLAIKRVGLLGTKPSKCAILNDSHSCILLSLGKALVCVASCLCQCLMCQYHISLFTVRHDAKLWKQIQVMKRTAGLKLA